MKMDYNVLDNLLRTILTGLYYLTIILIVSRLVYLIYKDLKDRRN